MRFKSLLIFKENLNVNDFYDGKTEMENIPGDPFVLTFWGPVQFLISFQWLKMNAWS